MASKDSKNPKGVVNTFRRTWDKEEFEDKAEKREKEVRRRMPPPPAAPLPPPLLCA